jgi:hypothetical protein
MNSKETARRLYQTNNYWYDYCTTTPSPLPHYRPPFESPLDYQEHDLARLKLRLRHRNFHHYPLEIFHRGTYVTLQA